MLEAWHGPIVLAFSAAHGVDAGDLLALPFVLLAVAVARRHARDLSSAWALPASGTALGLALLLTGIPTHDGGTLVPAGGGTLDGAIAQTFAGGPLRAGRWTNVALSYDGSAERLYVNGRMVASHAASGRIETPANPLWIGGNLPYGEHFEGLIDEVRVYGRALDAREIRADMTTAVAPARGLIAAYPFDAGSGRTAVDASGEGNTGEIRGATWVAGRFGRALRFDGVDSVVRVPPSSSLGLTSAMTLSAWIRPDQRQEGWRTIVQRQTDAYFLTAGSGHVTSYGAADTLRVAFVVVAGAWFCIVIATGRGPRTAVRRRWWWAPLALFALGSAADAVFAPYGALTGPALVALWLAVTAATRIERTALLLAAIACIVLTLASLTDTAGVGDAFYRNEGGTARAMALGVLFVVAAVATLRHAEVVRPYKRS
jgi:hypothetical protein